MNKFHCGKKFDDLTFENKEIKTIAIQFPPKSCNSNFTIVLPHAHKWPFWWHLNKIKSIFLVLNQSEWNSISVKAEWNLLYLYCLHLHIYAYINAEMLNYTHFFFHFGWNLLTMHCGITFFAKDTCNTGFKIAQRRYLLEKTSRLERSYDAAHVCSLLGFGTEPKTSDDLP